MQHTHDSYPAPYLCSSASGGSHSILRSLDHRGCVEMRDVDVRDVSVRPVPVMQVRSMAVVHMPAVPAVPPLFGASGAPKTFVARLGPRLCAQRNL